MYVLPARLFGRPANTQLRLSCGSRHVYGKWRKLRKLMKDSQPVASLACLYGHLLSNADSKTSAVPS